MVYTYTMDTDPKPQTQEDTMNEDHITQEATRRLEALHPYLTREIKLAPPSPPEKTAEEYREEAARHAAERLRSQQESDTDGFLSQWASGLNSSLASRRAEIKENGGNWEFWGLYRRADGKRIRAKMIDGKYGLCWAICDEHSTFTGQFFSVDGTGSKRTKLWKAGLEERREMAPAWAKMDGKGTGLSGQAWVSTYRIDGGYPLDAVNLDSPVEDPDPTPDPEPSPKKAKRTEAELRRDLSAIMRGHRVCQDCGQVRPTAEVHVPGRGMARVCQDCYDVAVYELTA